MSDMSAAGEAKRPRSPLVSVALRWLREPLLHFLLLGAALFAAYSYFEPRTGESAVSMQIRLTPDELLQLALVFQAQWQRPPTPAELGRLVENKVQEEVLYREAVAMGLDRDDVIVKRRMTQKMQFLAEDVAAAYEPATAELEAWYARSADKFALPGRLNFRHLYFSPDRRGVRARDDAGQALAKLAGEPIDSRLAESLGDPFMLQDYYGDRSPQQLAKEFGPPFAKAVFRATPGAWQGPIESGFGWHLVFVDSFVPGRVPAFAEVESEVKTVWLADRKAEAWRKAYDAMRAKYTVLLPAIPEAIERVSPSLPTDSGRPQPPAKPAP